MAKEPHAGEHHRGTGRVCCRDHLLVTHRAARLDHRGRTGRDGGFQAVGERKESVRGHHAAARQGRVETGRLCRCLTLPRADARVHTGWLPAPIPTVALPLA